MEGWIELHRKFITWEWFHDSKMVHLFIYILLSANYTEKQWQGVIIKRGQLLTGLNSLSKNTSISVQSLRTCLSKLEKTGELTIKSTNKYSIITVCKYDDYQPLNGETNKQTNKQLTNNQQTTNKQLTTTNKDKKVNNVIKEREHVFKKEVYVFTEKYRLPMLDSFISYWTEPNKSKTKMRFELQRTWDTSRRLATWANNQHIEKKPRKESSFD